MTAQPSGETSVHHDSAGIRRNARGSAARQLILWLADLCRYHARTSVVTASAYDFVATSGACAAKATCLIVFDISPQSSHATPEYRSLYDTVSVARQPTLAGMMLAMKSGLLANARLSFLPKCRGY